LNKMSEELYKLLDIKRSHTSGYHPQCNAQAEVGNKTIARYLASFVNTTTLDWEQCLAPLTLCYNTSFHRSIKNSPFVLTFGMEPRLPYLPTPDIRRKFYGESNAADIFNRFQFARNLALENNIETTEKSHDYFNKKAKPHGYQNGQLVLLQETSYLGRNTKLAPKYSGPHRVISQKGPVNVEILMTNDKKLIVHVSRLKPYLLPFSKDASISVPKEDDRPEFTVIEPNARELPKRNLSRADTLAPATRNVDNDNENLFYTPPPPPPATQKKRGRPPKASRSDFQNKGGIDDAHMLQNPVFQLQNPVFGQNIEPQTVSEPKITKTRIRKTNPPPPMTIQTRSRTQSLAEPILDTSLQATNFGPVADEFAPEVAPVKAVKKRNYPKSLEYYKKIWLTKTGDQYQFSHQEPNIGLTTETFDIDPPDPADLSDTSTDSDPDEILFHVPLDDIPEANEEDEVFDEQPRMSFEGGAHRDRSASEELEDLMLGWNPNETRRAQPPATPQPSAPLESFDVGQVITTPLGEQIRQPTYPVRRPVLAPPRFQLTPPRIYPSLLTADSSSPVLAGASAPQPRQFYPTAPLPPVPNPLHSSTFSVPVTTSAYSSETNTSSSSQPGATAHETSSYLQQDTSRYSSPLVRTNRRLGLRYASPSHPRNQTLAAHFPGLDRSTYQHLFVDTTLPRQTRSQGAVPDLPLPRVPLERQVRPRPTTKPADPFFGLGPWPRPPQ